MEITYLGHSGFLVETSAAYFLFDCIRGDLPDFNDTKKLYVFVSHAHHDHWDRGIFTDERLKNAECFVLGFDIRGPFGDMACKDPRLAAVPVVWALPQQTIRTEDFSCLPLLSTDEGVAFLIRTGAETIYHAGDLNWWHWNGDPDERNLERARNFKREIDRMKGIPIDVAFVPLDPRQEDAYRFCMDYCMETLDAAHVFPMHFWGDHELAITYRASLKPLHPDWFGRFHPIRFEGEKFMVPGTIKFL